MTKRFVYLVSVRREAYVLGEGRWERIDHGALEVYGSSQRAVDRFATALLESYVLNRATIVRIVDHIQDGLSNPDGYIYEQDSYSNVQPLVRTWTCIRKMPLL